MKNLKMWSILLLVAAGLVFYGFSDSENLELDVTTATVSTELAAMKGPCGGTGATHVQHITDQFECEWRGFVWWNGKCWACH